MIDRVGFHRPPIERTDSGGQSRALRNCQRRLRATLAVRGCFGSREAEACSVECTIRFSRASKRAEGMARIYVFIRGFHG